MRRLSFWALAFALALVACKSSSSREDSSRKGTSSEKPAVDPSDVAGAPSPSPQAPTLDPKPESSRETALRIELETLIAETDLTKTRALEQRFAIDEPAEWFSGVFGAELGVVLAKGYVADRRALDGLAQLLRYNYQAKKRRRVSVERFESSTDPGATKMQAGVLDAMQRKTPLFSVRFSSPGANSELHLHNFVDDGERFRYVGELRGAVSTAQRSANKLDVRQRDASKR